MMKPFDIFIAYVSWQGGGKSRPVLLFLQDAKSVKVFQITSQYEHKSEAIRAKYFKINDWAQAGLDKLSYIDTWNKLELPLNTIDKARVVGQLTDADRQRLIEFLL